MNNALSVCKVKDLMLQAVKLPYLEPTKLSECSSQAQRTKESRLYEKEALTGAKTVRQNIHSVWKKGLFGTVTQAKLLWDSSQNYRCWNVDNSTHDSQVHKRLSALLPTQSLIVYLRKKKNPFPHPSPGFFSGTAEPAHLSINFRINCPAVLCKVYSRLFYWLFSQKYYTQKTL